MKPEHFNSPESSHIEAISANIVQIALMPLAYEDAHPGEHPDMTNPEEKRQVVAEWLTQNSELYREFADAHTDETIDLDDTEAVHDLWERIKKETLH